MILPRAIQNGRLAQFSHLFSSLWNVSSISSRMNTNLPSNANAILPQFHILNRSRFLIECRGPDAKTLLQGLITNDMSCLETHLHEVPNQHSSSLATPHCCSVIYAFFLNTNVRILFFC